MERNVIIEEAKKYLPEVNDHSDNKVVVWVLAREDSKPEVIIFPANIVGKDIQDATQVEFQKCYVNETDIRKVEIFPPIDGYKQVYIPVEYFSNSHDPGQTEFNEERLAEYLLKK